VKREDFVLPLYDSGSYQGKLYAIPGGADVWSLFYNKGHYEAAGIPSDKAPATISEFGDISKKVLKKAEDGTIEQASMWYTTGWLPQWMYAFGVTCMTTPRARSWPTIQRTSRPGPS